MSERRDRLGRLRSLLERVEHYQPIYGIDGLVPTPARPTLDRCTAIEAAVGQVRGLRMLDIGSSLGYVTHYFAERGARATGWDGWLENVEVSVIAGDVIGSPARFVHRSATLDTVEAIAPGNFDVALALSVLHHSIHFEGLEATQRMVHALLQRIPTLVVELARRGEDPDLPWDASMPDDPLDVLALIRDDAEITLLAEFGTHLSHHPRPLYLVQRPRLVNVGARRYPYDRRSGQAFDSSPAAGPGGLQRRYYLHDDHVIKQYEVRSDEIGDREQVANEIAVLLDLTRRGSVERVPVIVDFELGADTATIVTRRVPGEPIGEPGFVPLAPADVARLAGELLQLMVQLNEHGYHHNDLRSWNVMWGPQGAWLIDFGLAGPLEREDHAVALMWVLHAAATGQREGFEQGKTRLPDRTAFGEALWPLYDLVAGGESSPARLFAGAGLAG